MSSADPSPELLALRQRIDELDRQLLDVLTERINICHEVARIKEHSDTPIIQPDRVRNVVTTRRQYAIDRGIDPDFAEDIMRVVLSETHRIEIAGRRPDGPPEKTASPEGIRSAIDTVSSRVDHVVIAVTDLAQATTALTQKFGFHESSPANLCPGIAAVSAGGVTLVLVDPQAGPDVTAYLAQHGSGVHHVAIEVLNAGYAHSTLQAAGNNLSPIVIDEHGHEQFFTVRDSDSGIQVGFIARTGHRVGVATQNILESFKTN
jgi:chorismate mutase-like protein